LSHSNLVDNLLSNVRSDDAVDEQSQTDVGVIPVEGLSELVRAKLDLLQADLNNQKKEVELYLATM
jgi:hypothetical protein